MKKIIKLLSLTLCLIFVTTSLPSNQYSTNNSNPIICFTSSIDGTSDDINTLN